MIRPILAPILHTMGRSNVFTCGRLRVRPIVGMDKGGESNRHRLLGIVASVVVVSKAVWGVVAWEAPACGEAVGALGAVLAGRAAACRDVCMAVQGVPPPAFGYRPKNGGALQLQYASTFVNGASLCARSRHEARGGGSRTAGSSKGVDGECSREGKLCGIGGQRHVVAVQNRVGQVCQAAAAAEKAAADEKKKEEKWKTDVQHHFSMTYE